MCSTFYLACFHWKTFILIFYLPRIFSSPSGKSFSSEPDQHFKIISSQLILFPSLNKLPIALNISHFIVALHRKNFWSGFLFPFRDRCCGIHQQTPWHGGRSAHPASWLFHVTLLTATMFEGFLNTTMHCCSVTLFIPSNNCVYQQPSWMYST